MRRPRRRPAAPRRPGSSVGPPLNGQFRRRNVETGARILADPKPSCRVGDMLGGSGVPWVDGLDKLQNLGSMVASQGAKLFEGIKAGADLITFQRQVLDIGELRLLTTSLVAEGGYSFVFTAREMKAGAELGRMFAVKKVIAQDPDTIEVGRAEMRLLKSLPAHPHVIKYYGGKEEPKGGGVIEMYMVLEYCPNGSLVDLVLPGNPPLPEGRLLSIFHSVCKAVAHLHSQNPPIAHRDLKLENVLCNASGLYKLCDFGSVTTRRVRPDSRAERLREEDIIQRFSTLMYRCAAHGFAWRDDLPVGTRAHPFPFPWPRVGARRW